MTANSAVCLYFSLLYTFSLLCPVLNGLCVLQGTLEIFAGLGMVLGPSIGGGLYGVSVICIYLQSDLFVILFLVFTVYTVYQSSV